MEQGEPLGNVTATAASHKLHEQTATSRAEYSSVGVDKNSYDKLSGTEQDRTARTGRTSGTTVFFCEV